MTEGHGAIVPSSLTDPFRPLTAGGWYLQLAECPVDHGVDQMRLAGEIVIEAHRFAADCLGQAAIAQGLDPFTVNQIQGRGGDSIRSQALVIRRWSAPASGRLRRFRPLNMFCWTARLPSLHSYTVRLLSTSKLTP